MLCTLFFATGCDVQRDDSSVENATRSSHTPKPSPRPTTGTGATVATSTYKTATQPVGPVILDEPGDVSFTREPAGNKGGVPQQILPPLYLQTNAAVEPAKIAAANPGLKIRAFKDANSVMTLDANEVAPGGEITGTIAAPANGDTLRLLWIDEAGRVVTAQYFVAANTPPTGSFTFKMPAGTFGREHKIALVRIPTNGGAMKVEASIPVRIVASISWDDYTVFSAGDAARKLFPANSAQIERALSADENPLIVKTWGAKVDEYDKTRDPKLFQRQPPLFDETAVKTAKDAIEKNLDRRHDGSSLWSLGDAVNCRIKACPSITTCHRTRWTCSATGLSTATGR